MVKIYNFIDLPSHTHGEIKDNIEGIHEGRKYQKVVGQNDLTNWGRIALITHAVALTLLSLGIGLFFSYVRQLWVDAYRGQRLNTFYVYSNSLPKPIINVEILPFLCEELSKAELIVANDIEKNSSSLKNALTGFDFIPNFKVDVFAKKLIKLFRGTDLGPKILPTLIKVGNHLIAVKDKELTRNIYNKDMNSIPFFISPKREVYFCGKFLGDGQDKTVYEAMSFTGNDELVWITSVIEKVGNHSAVAIDLNDYPKYALALFEERFLEKLHKEKIPNIPPPYIVTSLVGDPVKGPITYTRIQKRFNQSEKLIANIKNGGKVDARGILKIGIDIADALASIHSKGWVHTDVKPENILFDREPETGKIIQGILTDFGSESETGETLQSGTRDFLPSESVVPLGTQNGEDKFNFKGVADPLMDSFALGVSLVELVTGSALLDASHFSKVMQIKERALDKFRDVYRKKAALKDPKLQTPPKEANKYFSDPNHQLMINKEIILKKQQVQDNPLLDEEEKRICVEILNICKRLITKDIHSGRLSCKEAKNLLSKISHHE